MSDVQSAHERVADRLTQLVWLMDPALEEFRYVGPVYEEMTGRSVEEAGRSLATLDLVHPDDREAFRSWLEGIRSDVADDAPEERYELTFRLVDEDAGERRVTSVALPLRDGEEIVGVAGFTTDVSAQVEQERELLTRVDRLDEFASMVSHDLRNPLAVAQGHVDLYRETGDPGHLDSVEAALSRIEAIADEILALARHGVDDADRTSFSLGALAREAWDEVDTRDATLEVAGEVPVEGMRSQLRQLLVNLFRNAVGHGGDDVTVRVGPLDDGFVVEDTGVGIPESERERVFEHGHTTGYAGSGVGLTVVSRVAEAHGWSVALGESEEGGARFEFHAGG